MYRNISTILVKETKLSSAVSDGRAEKNQQEMTSRLIKFFCATSILFDMSLQFNDVYYDFGEPAHYTDQDYPVFRENEYENSENLSSSDENSIHPDEINDEALATCTRRSCNCNSCTGPKSCCESMCPKCRKRPGNHHKKEKGEKPKLEPSGFIFVPYPLMVPSLQQFNTIQLNRTDETSKPDELTTQQTTTEQTTTEKTETTTTTTTTTSKDKQTTVADSDSTEDETTDGDKGKPTPEPAKHESLQSCVDKVRKILNHEKKNHEEHDENKNAEWVPKFGIVPLPNRLAVKLMSDLNKQKSSMNSNHQHYLRKIDKSIFRHSAKTNKYLH